MNQDKPVGRQSEISDEHCPACTILGQSLEAGQGTHRLGTVEHPEPISGAIGEAATPEKRKTYADWPNRCEFCNHTIPYHNSWCKKSAQPVKPLGPALPPRPETYIDGRVERIKPGETVAAVRYITALETELSRLRSASPERTGWIEIKEGCEMPQPGYSVNVVENGYTRHGYLRTIKEGPRIRRWNVEGHHTNNVTHWQPLPLPPPRGL